MSQRWEIPAYGQFVLWLHPGADPPPVRVPRREPQEHAQVLVRAPDLQFTLPTDLAEQYSWMDDASCAGVYELTQVLRACRTCPVADACRNYGERNRLSGPFAGALLDSGVPVRHLHFTW